MSSHIRAFVQWKDQTVFAGEEIQCTITFTNLAPLSPSPANSHRDSKLNGLTRKPSLLSRPPIDHRRPPNSHASVPQIQVRGHEPRSHRPALSLNLPVHSGEASRNQSATTAVKTDHSNGGHSNHNHKRSVSIISLGGSETTEGLPSPRLRTPQRPSRNHARSASLQVLPRALGSNGDGNGNGLSSPYGPRSATAPSPLHLARSAPSRSESHVELPLSARYHRRPSGLTLGPGRRGPSRGRDGGPSPFNTNFKFPPGPPGASPPEPNNSSLHPAFANADPSVSPRGRSPRSPIVDIDGAVPIHLAPISKVRSASSMNGSARSSGEFYSVSNNSSETLASDYPQPYNRLLPTSTHVRRPSNLSIARSQSSIETLMMGYVQVMGSFTLDGSLVNQGPFEDVKRKGVIGGQGGGGVVGVENNKRGSGLFGSFGWGNIGESIGGFLGGGELSSIKEMRGIASSRSVPLLSTPQSVLFVDLRLAPGESKSYSYSFSLPKGLPPTHKGKTIKISYQLVIGTHRPAAAKEQRVRQVEIPFRVFGSVDRDGETLGHDLMSPYILLRDQAHASILSSTGSPLNPVKKHSPSPHQDLEDFLSYTSKLLSRPSLTSTDSIPPLLSPTEPNSSHHHLRRQSSAGDLPPSAKETIDLAILRSNIPRSPNLSPNRFEIARNGQRIASIILNRPAHRLGETVTAVIDFEGARIPCYSLRATLESAESVDPTIAMRSPASIERVTKKIHARLDETTLFARRIIFSPTIPMAATPEFITTGVSLGWRIRIEFVTSRLVAEATTIPPNFSRPRLPITRRGDSPLREPLVGEDNDDEEYEHEIDEGEKEQEERRESVLQQKQREMTIHPQLLEEIGRDERGSTSVAVEGIPCESFEVAIPITVFGATAGETEKAETEALVV